MSDRYFLDTNIFAYSFDHQSKGKRDRAQRLIAQALQDNLGLISTQVIQEFFNVALKKFERPMERREAELYLHQVFGPLCEVFPTLALYEKTLIVRETTGYSFYDSLILSAALIGRCQILYSEDLQHGQTIEGMRIENPFL